MTRSECFKILGLDESAGPNAIKKAYRKLAFELHPDLNPCLENATKNFQELNEAYVVLMREYENTSFTPFTNKSKTQEQKAQPQKEEQKTKQKNEEDAHKAYQKAQASAEAQSKNNNNSNAKKSILNDLLNDPFARRVFEDIYSQVQYKQGSRSYKKPKKTSSKAIPRSKTNKSRAVPKYKTPTIINIAKKAGESLSKVSTSIKYWLRKQIDDEQVIYLPGEHLVAGAKIRLQIKHGLSDDKKFIEIILPPEFTPEKPLRLKSLGKHLGKLEGDLYLWVLDEDSLEE